MKTIKLILFGTLLLPWIFGTGPVKAEMIAHKSITQKLISLLDTHPEVRGMLKNSIAKAQKVNPDLKTNSVQSLEDYFRFIDQASELIPQEVVANPANLEQEQILQSICYFYFLIDQPLDELKGQGLFNNTIQYYGPFSTWAREFADSWGEFLDTEASWNETVYQEFYSDPRFGLQNNWYEPSDQWNTFNRFFSRYLASPDTRPIAAQKNSSVVTAPADSVPQGVWPIDADSNIKVLDGLQIKLAKFFSIPELLGKDSAYANAFAGGVLTHTFLNVNDYHRYHFAVGGTIREKKNIQENVALEVSWSPEQNRYLPIDSTGWQFSQTRGYVIVDTGKYGLVALIPMGMAQVSSVNFEENVQVDVVVKKGDMLGTFLFGGSDFVMLFQEKAGFQITAPADKQLAAKSSSDCKTEVTIFQHILVGEAYGIMKGAQ